MLVSLPRTRCLDYNGRRQQVSCLGAHRRACRWCLPGHKVCYGHWEEIFGRLKRLMTHGFYFCFQVEGTSATSCRGACLRSASIESR